MALYYGFFDATLDSGGSYDRTYSSDDFDQYFANILGSGVCVYGNADSMLVSIVRGNAVVAPGYLLIDGCWLKNDAAYTVSLDGAAAGEYAILARLSRANRLFTLEYAAKAESYSNALVLAYVTVSGAAEPTVVDTRTDTAICGTIDSAGNLATLVEDALDYIDNTVASRIASFESALSTQSAAIQSELNAVEAAIARDRSDVSTAISTQTAAANAAVAKVEVPAVGVVQYAAAAPGSKWIKCDGRYIAKADYPDLVSLLKNKIPGFSTVCTTLSEGAVGRNISNAVLYKGSLWVYSLDTKRLYGVPVAGGALKTITVTSTSAGFTALVSPQNFPLCLSVANGDLYLSQIRGTGTATSTILTLLVYKNFAGTESSIQLADRFSYANCPEIETWFGTISEGLPYVVSEVVDGTTKYAMVVSGRVCYWTWSASDSSPTSGSVDARGNILYSFNPKNQNECICHTVVNSSNLIRSILRGIYSSTLSEATNFYFSHNVTPIAGDNEILLDFFTDYLNTTRRVRCIYAVPGSYLYYGGATCDNIFGVNALPAGFRFFSDASVYCADKGMWFVFTGSGLLFMRSLRDSQWGYYDTTAAIGTLLFGHLIYDASSQSLLICGQASDGHGKVVKINLSDWNYSDNGIYLPTLSEGGIPGYIKALEG